MYSNSILAFFTAGLAVVSAYTKPVGSEPKGNPISQPGLASIVPVGENFTVTWDPTTDGTVTLLLLKGPAANLEVVYPIAEKIENSGSFVWMPKKDLAPGDTGYGLQLIVDATGQYQYTTQFGISNPDYKASSASTTSCTTSTAASATRSALTSSYPIKANTTFAISGTAAPVGTGAPSSGYMPSNSSLVRPTGSMSVPSSLKMTATLVTYSSAAASATGVVSAASASASPSATNAAGNLAASIGGLAIAAGIAVFAF